MATVGRARATIEDLYRAEGKADLIGGSIVEHLPTGYKPSRVAFRICQALDDHAAVSRVGEAFTDNMGFSVPELSSGRESFSPDAAYYIGPLPDNPMRFIAGPPTFAVEVRGENDYGPAAEAEMAAKRDGYFEAGTLVVWDVDPIAEAVHAYRAADPSRPTTFARGQRADAEPALPGWTLVVGAIFE